MHTGVICEYWTDNLENDAKVKGSVFIVIYLYLFIVFDCYLALGSNKYFCKCVTVRVAAEDLSAFLFCVMTWDKYTSACVHKCKAGGGSTSDWSCLHLTGFLVCIALNLCTFFRLYILQLIVVN